MKVTLSLRNVGNQLHILQILHCAIENNFPAISLLTGLFLRGGGRRCGAATQSWSWPPHS
jgi:hypothetical protein